MLYRLSTLLSFFVFKYFFSLEVKGKEYIPNKENFILVANHLSNLDPPLLAVACPRRISFVAKKELFKNKIFALYLQAVGAIGIERGKITVQTLRQLLNLLKIRPLLIFPEGSRGVGLEKMQAGAGFLYKKSRYPVIAAKISGTDKILAPGGKTPQRAKIKVIFKLVEEIEELKDPKLITAQIKKTIKSIQ